MTTLTTSPFETVEHLLGDRAAFTRRLEAGDRLPALARATLATIVVGGAGFGAALGAWRGGLQILYAALKLPAVLLLTAAICAPALTALGAAFDRPTSLRRDLALVLGALALGSLCLLASAPLIYLAGHLHLGYHALVLLVVGCCAVAGLAAVGFLWRGLAATGAPRLLPVVTGLVLVFSLTGAQLSWTLRPWLLRPRAPEPTFVRSIEGSLFESVSESLDSARGRYHRDSTGGNSYRDSMP